VLIADMKKDLDFRIVDAAMAELEEQGEKNKIEKINVQVRGFEGTRQIQMNTTALQSMISALKVTRSIASEMGVHFADFIEPIVQIVTTNLIHLKLSMTVRKEATRMCSALIFCCPTNGHKQQLLRIVMPQIAQ
jgi:hypothetical protein